MREPVIAANTEVVRAILLPLSPEERAEVLARIASTGSTDERGAIMRALALHSGYVSKAAAALGLSRRQLQTRMRRLGMPAGPRGPKPRSL
jgi:transcriptional regulator with GAF, ATPase, and Fis domain